MDLSFSAVQLRDYAQSLGWKLVPEALGDGLFVLNHADFEREQLVFAKDEAAPDYGRSLELSAQILAELQRLSFAEVVARLVRVGDDTLSFRLWGGGIDQTKVKLGLAVEAIEGAKGLLLAAAHSVLSPQFYHPRLSRREAVDFVDSATFGLGMPRSFVFNVSCPVRRDGLQHQWAPEIGQGPFARIVTLATRLGLEQLVNVIEGDDLGLLKSDEKVSRGPLVSSNFCAALVEFQDQSIKNSLDVEFSWSPEVEVASQFQTQRIVRVQKDYFGRVEEVGRELRSRERAQKDFFVGRVDRLNGDPGADGRRFGEVVLNLLLSDDEKPVKARVLLSADAYEAANQAHMKAGSFVIVEGILNEGRQPRLLEFANEEAITFHIAGETSTPSFERPKRKISFEDV